MNTPFLEKLERARYFFGSPPADAADLKKDILARGWSALFSDTHRLYSADAEELAEEGVSRFLRQIEPFLRGQGVTLPAISEQYSGDGYSITIGNNTHQIWSKTDLVGEHRGVMAWGLSMTRAFAIVDDMLAAADSEERLYAVYGGHDLHAYFLTPQLFELIVQHPDATPLDTPYAPTELPPHFGAPPR